MAYTSGTASNLEDLMNRMIGFLTGSGTWGAVSYTGTGDGSLGKTNLWSSGATPAAVTENWAVTCTVAAANGGTFSVVGSVSGAHADAVVGTPYNNGKVAFSIADGSVDFIIGDHFNFSTVVGQTTTSGEAWLSLGADASGVNWYKGHGLAGTDDIFSGINWYKDYGGDIFSVHTSVASNFSAAKTWLNQTGNSPVVCMACWDDPMPYWFVLNGQRLVVVIKVSTTYHTMYFGKFLPYGSPSEYAYPVMVGGSGNDGARRWSNTWQGNRQFVDPGPNSLCVFWPDGVWRWHENDRGDGYADNYACVWPFGTGYIVGNGALNRIREQRENIDGTYTLTPLIMACSSPALQILGEIDGCFHVTGYSNAAENIITIGGKDYLVVQDIFRTDRWNYWALRLD